MFYIWGHDYICDCPTGRVGKNCKTVEFSPCAPSNPCLNNGICDEVIQDGKQIHFNLRVNF